MLQHLGYLVDVVTNGLEALEALKQKTYRIILMDIQMPLMDGLETTRTIRRWLSPKEQPKIIAVTAFALDYSREMCIDAGMDDYMAKPIHKEYLAQMLERYNQRA